MNMDETMNFKIEKENNERVQEILKDVYPKHLKKKDITNKQIVGYILSGDPTYITSYKDARSKIRTIERDELLEKMVEKYIGIDEE